MSPRARLVILGVVAAVSFAMLCALGAVHDLLSGVGKVIDQQSCAASTADSPDVNAGAAISDVGVQNVSFSHSVRLSGEKLANIRTIISTVEAIPEIPAAEKHEADLIALITAGTETGDTYHNFVGGDATSVGVMQQQSNWGTWSQRHDVAWATRAFILGANGNKGLLDQPNWFSRPPGEVAQAVQISAYPDAYVRRIPFAEQILKNLKVDGSQVISNTPSTCDASQTGSADALIQQAITIGKARAGKPYVFGATGPSSFDCSGFIYYMFKQVGISFPRTAAEQMQKGPAVPGIKAGMSSAQALPLLQRGDLVFWHLESEQHGTTIAANDASHVGMYIGNGQVLEAARPGVGVVVENMYWNGFIGATRPITDAVAAQVVPPTGKWVYPLDPMPAITSPYGMRMHPIKHIWELHDGTDFGAACGVPIHNIANGVVARIYYEGDGGGNIIEVSYGRYHARYEHTSRYAGFKVGDTVGAGDVIAYVGQTGAAAGCHLHLTILDTNKPDHGFGSQTLNPVPFLNGHGLSVGSSSQLAA